MNIYDQAVLEGVATSFPQTIPEKEVPEFKQLLVKYYESEDISVIASFMKERCWKTI